MSEPSAERSVFIQMQAAKQIIAQLRETGNDDDAQLVSDTIEGETSLVEAIDAALSELDECDILKVGIKAKLSELDGRLKVVEDRADRIRALIEQAMLSTDQYSLKLPTATLTLVKRKQSVVLVDEADIPSKFWVEQERPAPKLDKRALAEALKAKEEVPGATLDNGSYGLTVRRK